MTKGSHLGDLEELVLLAVMRLGGDAHGAGIREELTSRAGRTVSISTIYVTLMRLEEKGYARSWKGESSPERGGKAKRHYAVTPAGFEVMASARDARGRMWDGISEGATRG